MGTYYRVVIADTDAQGENPLDENLVKAGIEAQLESVNSSMSTYINDSELSRFNQLPANTVFEMSEDLHQVMSAALQLSEQSNGAFDVTINPLVRLWGFGSDGKISDLPDADLVDTTLRSVGWDALLMDGDDLLKLRTTIEVDLSAIAKGFAIDKVAGQLESYGLQHWLIDIGGELKASGRNGERAWQVAVEKPSQTGGVELILPLRDKAIATSGDYRNIIRIDDRIFSHAINPKTGYPVEHMLASVSVLHESAMQADAIATTILILGEIDGERFARERGLSVFMIVRDGPENEFQTIATGEFTTFAH